MDELYKIFISEPALVNLESLPPAHVDKILNALRLLETFPEMGFHIQSPNWPEFRQLIIDWYRVVYKLEKEKNLVTIYLVKHGKMNFK
jgi:mRNA-degrading endonuclease RelE of RelBE toxin-antitoxin system